KRKRCEPRWLIFRFQFRQSPSIFPFMGISESKFNYEVAIIGGGSAGYAAARITSEAGLGTVVFEGGEEVGGLCILRGCMPSKALLYAAEIMHLARHAGQWGLK